MIICVGVALASAGESYFSLLGFTFQSLAILAESSRLVLTNVLMKQLKLDPLSSLYYIAPLCATFIGVACFIFELNDLPLDRIVSPNFMIVLMVNGIIAFTLNIAVVLLIGNTSALVLTLAGIIKDILLVFLSIIVFGSPVTPLQYAGYGVALMGLNLHKVNCPYRMCIAYIRCSLLPVPPLPPSKDPYILFPSSLSIPFYSILRSLSPYNPFSSHLFPPLPSFLSLIKL